MPPIFGNQGFFSHIRQQFQDPVIRCGAYAAVSMYGCMTAINSMKAGESPDSSVALLIAGTVASFIDLVGIDAYQNYQRQQPNVQPHPQAHLLSGIKKAIDKTPQVTSSLIFN